MNTISIIIPYHQNKKMLATSLNTLQDSLLSHDYTIEVIVVANNINEQEIDIELDARQYKVLQITENLFYPKAIREGVRIATGEYLVFADPDIFYCENWLSNMMTCYKSHENVGCIGAKLINPINNRILDFGIGYNGYHTAHFFRGLPYNNNLCQNDVDVQSICSALLLMKHSLFDTLKGFDIEMPYAYCDNDLCLRIKEQGYNIWGAANALAYHKGSTDPINSKYYAFQYLKEDCASAFFYKNKERYHNDYKEFFRKSLENFFCNGISKGYIFVNLSTAYDWRSYMKIVRDTGITVLDISESVVKERNIACVDLFNTVESSLIASKTPLLYFVDSFTCCYGNSLWFSLRDVRNDIIVDRNANCIPCWYIANYLL